MNKTAKFVAIIFALVIVVLLAILIFVNPPRKNAPAANVVSGMPNYPTSPDGHVTVQDPVQGQTVASPVVVTGFVIGGEWFFEGGFSVQIIDADGTILGAGRAVAKQGEWTSTGTVPFSARILFSAPHSASGTVVFSKDHPSGSTHNDASFSVPVRF